MKSYEDGSFSRFLMMTILANAVQMAPIELLRACGYTDRSTAQKTLASRAALLYDLDGERSQLRALQGSVILGVTIVDFTMDKDFRYWLQNAARIASRMGMHKRDLAREVEASVYKLCRRIWWSIYLRDVVMALTGLRSMRMVDSNDCDVEPLTEDDWEDEDIPPQYSHILTPITEQQKLVLVQNARLSIIRERFLAVTRTPARATPSPADNVTIDSLASQLATWRESLPEVLRIRSQPQGSNANVIPIMLMATMQRLECIVYRILVKRYQASNDTERYTRASLHLKTAMLEMDGLIGRVMVEETFSQMHPKFIGSVFAVLALRIESALCPAETDVGRAMAHTYIRQSVLFLRQVREMDNNPPMEGMLRMFEWALEQKGLAWLMNMPPKRDPSIANTGGNLVSSAATEAQHVALDPAEAEAYAKPNSSTCLDGSLADECMASFVNAASPTGDLTDDHGLVFEDLLGFNFLDDLGLSSAI